MLSYNNDPGFKARAIEKMQWHREQDMIAQNTYGKYVIDYNNDEQEKVWRGCHIACLARTKDLLEGVSPDLIRDGTNPAYPTDSQGEVAKYFGMPRLLADISETIFECLPARLARDWPVSFLEAMPVGKDLTPVLSRWFERLIADDVWGFASRCNPPEEKELEALNEQVVLLLSLEDPESHRPKHKDLYDLQRAEECLYRFIQWRDWTLLRTVFDELSGYQRGNLAEYFGNQLLQIMQEA